ncbi:peptidyl-tRNA hydrolase II domain protein [Vibrio phage 2.275.O._10N.286.54.E11]|nr:peptidyl-tRNA hydrolase II domain protein [Vibrio phage 2.275.O._10N.286.54.E11]
MSENISTQDLVQVVIVRKDLNLTPLQTGVEVSKASVGLITRCFESSKRFLGNYERNAYQKVITTWIDVYDNDTIVVEVDDEDELDAYLFTAEFSEIPTQIVKDKKGRISEDHPITAMAIGPYNKTDLFEAVGDLIPEEILKEYKD